MQYILQPSLEQRALVKEAIELWKRPDIKTEISKLFWSMYSDKRGERWKVIEEKVIANVSGLSLPCPLKNKVAGVIKPVGLQILRWMEYHEPICGRKFVKNFIGDLYWTFQGTIDNKKTAELLIDIRDLDIARRYKLACIYCFEEYIRILWNEIPERRRKFFYDNENPEKVDQSPIVKFWTYYIHGEIGKLNNILKRDYPENNPYEYALQWSVSNGNIAATKYFLEKLTNEEKARNIVKSTVVAAYKRCCVGLDHPADFPKEFYAGVICFLLSQMNEEQQVEVFEEDVKKGGSILKCFLDWPWQDFFLPTVEQVWNFLPEKKYDGILLNIVNRIKNSFQKDHTYRSILTRLWQKSPISYKKHIISKEIGWLLEDLLQLNDIENIKLILQDASPTEREKIIFSRRGNDICEGLMRKNRSELLEFLVIECMSSQDSMTRFKKEFKERMLSYYPEKKLKKEKDMWNNFFQLLDKLISSISPKDKEGEIELENKLPAKMLKVSEISNEHINYINK